MEYEKQYQHVPATKYECLLFDVDDTLYSLSSGLSKACTKNIEEFMVQKLGIEENKVTEINRVLYRNYGTSMAGLKAIGYNFDNDEYHSFVHGRLPYDNLKPDPVLRSLLLSLPIRKVIFSNGDKVHVAKVLKKLGLEGCFETVISFETLNPTDGSSTSESDDEISLKFRGLSTTSDLDASNCLETPVICKPFENAFEQAFKIANINPQKTIFFDDSIRNIQTGKEIGLHTVLVGTSHRTNGADYALESIHNIKEALPELWELAADKKSEGVMYSKKVAIQTSVMA
ncbi:HAD-superfamily hydrolase, subfamily IA, variant 3 [Corchorus olitorius]|uniref:HAD-superfamily hydrolase, subfamily IA, variant 3 n=1 Tax=Corchorus olitorius TaxID=93759 RepID=A0A1R3J8P0_9ROSI|nr:HAD-superfamily hydrolase, subfamily IA, variant 3 [Corchorus olitorius]